MICTSLLFIRVLDECARETSQNARESFTILYPKIRDLISEETSKKLGSGNFGECRKINIPTSIIHERLLRSVNLQESTRDKKNLAVCCKIIKAPKKCSDENVADHIREYGRELDNFIKIMNTMNQDHKGPHQKAE